MKLGWAISLIVCITWGCNEDDSNGKSESADISKDTTTINVPKAIDSFAIVDSSESENLETIFSEMIKVFNSKDTLAINKILSQQLGFHYITNPGAFIVVYSSSPTKLFSQHEWLGESEITEMQYGSAPQYSCDNESWDKEGVFITENPSSTFKDIYQLMLEYELTDNEISAQLLEADSAISHMVYDTKSGIGFYFGIFQNEWKLIGINIVTHCSA